MAVAQARNLEDLEGLTFAYPGPNCFGVAMYANENLSEIRGVDLNEFSAFVASSCEPVSHPEVGDIGTFHNGTDFIHAFVFLGEGVVLEKTGVDYMGKTPIHMRSIEHTIYTFEASPECRRWGGGSRDCYNTLEYFRCDKGNTHLNDELLKLETSIEKLFAEILAGKVGIALLDKVSHLIKTYEVAIADSGDDLLRGRLESFQKQFQFFQ